MHMLHFHRFQGYHGLTRSDPFGRFHQHRDDAPVQPWRDPRGGAPRVPKTRRLPGPMEAARRRPRATASRPDRTGDRSVTGCSACRRVFISTK
jgi:hypothetical protein